MNICCNITVLAPIPCVFFDTDGNVVYEKRGDSTPQSKYSFNCTTRNIKSNRHFTILSITGPARYKIAQKYPSADHDLMPKSSNINITCKRDLRSTPARTIPEDGYIEISPEVMKMPIHYRVFILFHEIGHTMFEDEEKCDTFAIIECVKRGYNMSNLIYCLTDVLNMNLITVQRVVDAANFIEENANHN